MTSYNTFCQSSSSYLELLNSQGEALNQDGAYEIPTWSSQQSHDEPLSQETPVKKDRKKWNPADDEILISAWLNTSKDPIIANQQKGVSFWQRVQKYYAESPHAIANGEQGVNINCKQRWFKINESTNKFCGAYAAAERSNSSGHSENDVLKVAHDIYFSDYKTKFTMEHCWCLLRFEQKFLNQNAINTPSPSVRTKRKPVGAADQSEATHTEQDSEIRPQGIKAVKADRKNSQGKSLAEYTSMWEVKRVDMAEKEKLQKLGILDTLLAKPEPLSAADQLIKDKIVAQYFAN
ncbi:PREDICTED: glutathione S-transferase T3-like [Camelina sativa]|uniref:Glutathione S-transferase T3-like n=1 Tax=Camelina sativa TaxID=90675 RepID=A0ABM0YY43_CAMSA|nr:PREDICTED: glutathione S-transferase T3-like [Camelina sativa]